jgi:hypothetical protein
VRKKQTDRGRQTERSRVINIKEFKALASGEEIN